MLLLFFFFLGPHLEHMEVARLVVESELQLLAYATATATSDPSRICDLHYCSQQCWILNPLSEARDRTCNLMIPTQICFSCAMIVTPRTLYFFQFIYMCIYTYIYCFLGLHPQHMESSFMGWIGAVAAGLHHSHSHARSKPCLWPIPQLTAILRCLTHRGSLTHWARPGINSNLHPHDTCWVR